LRFFGEVDFSIRLVFTAKHHFGTVSSANTITIGGVHWPINDTACAFSGESRRMPSPRAQRSA
jgi:hypothetical protein